MALLESQASYRMPVGFGPAPSLRQRHNGHRWDDSMARIYALTSSFVTEKACLERLILPQWKIDGDPIVTMELMHIRELQLLAGHGYNTLDGRFPVTCRTVAETISGPFFALHWENTAGPIITGRKHLSYAKLFCDISPMRHLEGCELAKASWEGHRLMSMTVSNLNPNTPPPVRLELIDYSVGIGSAHFTRSSCEQVPTLAHIVNTLADLPILGGREATAAHLRCDTSLNNHLVLEWQQ